MTLSDIYEEWDGMTTERKYNAWLKFVEYVNSHFDDCETIVYETLTEASELEQDDFFGTEGLKV